ncbi:GNAT family N-acetyltransferase [Neobacillus cucumis]|uniref:GNAT family N-acetyltransferase n=1 Tax=Neobacillus cucumis TaxID=1740721 RepID=A0A2N5HSW2_9BACI|nr:GNAT family N-acetyltransferase [Neobacillus cucumis]PLS08621.1 GNAT family N-acetyltransferase [Neobacillus cucumis]
MSVIVKLADKIEVATSHRLMLEAFEEYRNMEVPSSAINESLESMLEKYSNGTEKILLCLENDLPLGSLRFLVEGKEIYFMRVSVTPAARGKGLAKSMLTWLEQYAVQSGIAKLKCRVRMSLSKNILLYESLGYKITNEETVINPNGYEVKTVVMEKHLTN